MFCRCTWASQVICGCHMSSVVAACVAYRAELLQSCSTCFICLGVPVLHQAGQTQHVVLEESMPVGEGTATDSSVLLVNWRPSWAGVQLLQQQQLAEPTAPVHKSAAVPAVKMLTAQDSQSVTPVRWLSSLRDSRAVEARLYCVLAACQALLGATICIRLRSAKLTCNSVQLKQYALCHTETFLMSTCTYHSLRDPDPRTHAKPLQTLRHIEQTRSCYDLLCSRVSRYRSFATHSLTYTPYMHSVRRAHLKKSGIQRNV